MEIKIHLDVLFEALMILGHGRVWMEETEFDHFPGYSCYRDIRTWDNRIIAWWDDSNDTWQLYEEVYVVTLSRPPPKERRRALWGKMLPVNDAWSLLITGSII